MVYVGHSHTAVGVLRFANSPMPCLVGVNFNEYVAQLFNLNVFRLREVKLCNGF